MELAVKVVAVASPEALVVVVVAGVVLAKAPLGPEAGAVKVTVTPGTGLPALSLTVACRAVAKAAPTVALCGVPLAAVIEAGAPAVLVRAKLTVEAPGALATML